MADVKIMKAVEFSKTSAAFRKKYKDEDAVYAEGGHGKMPKYDGVFAAFKWEGDAVVGRTRTGELIRSCKHISDVLSEVLPKGKEIAGELWHPDLAFSVISGLARRHTASPELLFVAFNYYSAMRVDLVHFWMRYQMMSTEVIGNVPFGGPVRRAPLVKSTGESAIKSALAWKDAGGFDGAILVDLTAPYIVGLCKGGEIIKVKPLHELALTVLGVNVTTGEKTGRNVYTLTVDLGNGSTCQVGSGMPHDVTPADYIGKLVSVEFMGYTEDGNLREPRFRGICTDKTKADV